MAQGDSKVTVKIEGDADGLGRELKKADKGIAGLSASTKGLLAGAAFAGVTAGAIEFGQTALAEADRVGDATTRLELQLGDLSDDLVATADQYSNLGLSKQDVLEQEARFADIATGLGIVDAAIAGTADEVAATSAALALLGEGTIEGNVDLIGKAAGGSIKAYKELGIWIDEAAVAQQAMKDTGKTNEDQLTKGELATARLKLVMEALKPKLDAVASGQGDVESKTAAVQAKFETLQGEIGSALEGPLEDLLDWILSGIDGLGMLGDAIDGVKIDLKELPGPIGAAITQLRELLKLAGLIPDLQKGAGRVDKGGSSNGGSSSGGGSSGGGGGTFVPQSVNINVAPTGGADMEKAVVDALRAYNRKNGIL